MRAARVKRLIYGTFSGIPMLRQMDIAAPTYWLHSAALVSIQYWYLVHVFKSYIVIATGGSRLGHRCDQLCAARAAHFSVEVVFSR